MKAWEAQNYEGYSTVVFAETAGIAKMIAVETDVFEGCKFTDVRVRRCRPMDSHYRGLREYDWSNEEDRVTLVKDCGWKCVEPIDFECRDCPAKKYCHDMIDDLENEFYRRQTGYYEEPEEHTNTVNTPYEEQYDCLRYSSEG